MMIHAYDKVYLDDVMANLGVMMSYGVQSLGIAAADMYSMFISSGVAENIERGHPRFLSGLSGVELALMASGKEPAATDSVERGADYWSGWALAYLQWETGLSFADFEFLGLGIETVREMYEPYHEADITRFVSDARAIIGNSVPNSALKQYRKAAGLSQEELSEMSGVSLRAIRSYEQNSRLVSRAEAGSLLNLSRALGCKIENLL